MSNKTASSSLEEQETNLSKPTASSNGEQPKVTPAPRAITSKRVVIPPNAKRIVQNKQPETKPAEVSVPLTPLAPAVVEAPYVAPEPPSIEMETPYAAQTEFVPTTSYDAAQTEFVPTTSYDAVDTPVESEPVAAEASTPIEPIAITPVPSRIQPASNIPTKSVAGVAPATRTQGGAPAANTARPMGGGLKTAPLPYTLAEAELARIPVIRERRSRTAELVLWGLAALFLVVAAFFVLTSVFPDFLPNLTGGIAQGKPTTTVVAILPPTGAPSPTTTVLPTEAFTPAPLETQASIIIPTPPVDGVQFSSGPIQNISGWIASGEPDPHYADVNLHAGTFQGKELSSIVQFNLRNYPQNSKVLFAALELTGRDASRLGPDGDWQVELVENKFGTDWSKATVEEIANAKSLGTIGAPLTPSELGQGRLNQIILSDTERQLLEQQFQDGNVVFRLRGPAGTTDNLFTWESGIGSVAISAPTLHMVVVPGQFVIVTSTPEPQNILTQAAYVVRGTDAAKRNGTPTIFPPGVATATPGGGRIIIDSQTAIPQNEATAFARAALATAFARTTGTYTPTPPGVIIQYPTLTPAVIVEGLATATPIPPDADLLSIPIDYARCNCQGRILVLSDRYGGAVGKGAPIMLDDKGTELGKFSGDLYYNLAQAREPFSPDRTKHLIYPTTETGFQQIGYENLKTNEVVILTNFAKGIAYDAAWSADGNSIVFVSTERNNTDEIYIYQFDTGLATRITTAPENLLPLSKHPTFSPDGQEIAFWSTRSGTPQIWVVNRDGSNLRNISHNTFTENNPVWVK